MSIKRFGARYGTKPKKKFANIEKLQHQQQLIEIEPALAELQTTGKAYKMVGKLLVASSPEKLKKELLEKKETTSLRLKHFSQQEEKVRKNAEELQAAVVSELKQKK